MSHRNASRLTRLTRLVRLIPSMAAFATLPSQIASQDRDAVSPIGVRLSHDLSVATSQNALLRRRFNVVEPVPAPRLTQHMGSDTNGRMAGASFAAVAGSFLGLIAGSTVAYGTNDLGSAMLVVTGSTWAGAALGAGMATGNGGRAAMGSLAGIAAGIGAAALVSRFSSGPGALISFSVVHGLVTAAVAR